MSGAPKQKLALVRFSGEIGTKARATRGQFVRRLVANLSDALKSEGLTPRIRQSHNRIFVSLEGDPAEVSTTAASERGLDAISRVFGIQSISVVEPHPATDVEEVAAIGAELFRERVSGRRFAVRARRVGERTEIPLAPNDIERELGARLLGVSSGVDLSDPEETVHVELIGREAYFFPDRIPGQGGLPVGVGGNAIALISGGFDSAVAAWQLLRRGVCCDYAFCNLGGQSHQQGTLRVAQVLADKWSYGDQPRFHSFDFDPIVEQLRDRTRPRYWQVLLKRLMLRAAERLVVERKASAIVTGEAVGQVSSQTLPNLAVISRATRETVLRPLIGTNKDAIIELAKQIGTFELSKVVGEYCDMVPTRPATAATLDAIEAEEAKLDLSLIDAAVESRTVFKLRGLDIEALSIPDLEVHRIPEGATVIDLRTKDEFDSWHWPTATRLEFGQALRVYPEFDRKLTYVLYCEIGLKSAHLAEFMRKEGFEAFHVPGGLRTLKKKAPAD